VRETSRIWSEAPVRIAATQARADPLPETIYSAKIAFRKRRITCSHIGTGKGVPKEVRSE